MPQSASNTEMIIHRYAHHAPRSEDRVIAHEQVRTLMTDLALALDALVPESREKSVMHTQLQDAALALHGDDSAF